MSQTNNDQSQIDYDVTDPGRRYFLPVTITAVIFVVSLFAWMAAGVGDPAAPVNQWINQYGSTIIFVETGVVAATCVLAMYLDRQATLRAQAARSNRPRTLVDDEDSPQRL